MYCHRPRLLIVLIALVLTLVLPSISKAGLTSISDNDLAAISGAGCGTCAGNGVCGTAPQDTMNPNCYAGTNNCDSGCGNTYSAPTTNNSCQGGGTSKCNTTGIPCYNNLAYHCNQDGSGFCLGCQLQSTTPVSGGTTCTYS